MPTVTIEYTTGAERLALGQAIASLTRRRQAAASAPDGTAPGACEAAARGGGRALLRDTLAAAVRGRVEAAEQNGGGAPCARGGDGPGASGGGARADAPAAGRLRRGAGGVGVSGARVPAGGGGAALAEALNYRAGHRGRLNYPSRLRRGQSVGGGLVEGTVEQPLDRRLEQTGARWKAAHVGPFVELCALAAGPEWDSPWNN